MLRLLLVALVLQQGPAIPPPRGLVNDFAGVVPAASVARMEGIAGDVRAKSGGEIAVVTLADLEGREPVDVAVRIGREWGVGPMAEAGDARRNLGAVILLVPKETARDNRGRCWVATGRGAEGFLTDGEVASFCREATPFFAQRDYGRGLELVTLRVAREFAREGGFMLDSTAVAAAPAAPSRPARRRGISPIFLIFLLFMAMSMFGGGRRGRRGRRMPGVIFIPPIGGGGGWGGGGSWGGGGGGGFGGFGGGGGFSGGGGGSSW